MTRHSMTAPQRREKQPRRVVQENVPSSKNALSATAKGTSYLILLQLFTRLLTFTFNQLILRYTTPALFGFATIQLELLSSTILFLSREGFRTALQRDNGDIQRTVNIAYIPFVTGVLGAATGGYGFWRKASMEVKILDGFGSSIILYCLATIVELFIEPCFAISQRMLTFKTRTLAEGLAVVARCVVTCLSTIYLSQRGQSSAMPFGLGQLAYAIVLAGVYLLFSFKQVNLIPQLIHEEKGGKTYWFHRPTLKLALSVTGQSLFKHVLTEGDKLVLTFLTTPYTQGIYAIISNYGISSMKLLI
jgi:oligosaccharide translocation protein RFT1